MGFFIYLKNIYAFPTALLFTDGSAIQDRESTQKLVLIFLS